MKPLITTVRALNELAAGLALEAISSSPVLYMHVMDRADVLVASGDSDNEQLVLVIREDEAGLFVPDHLSDRSAEALGRIAAFAERARSTGPIVIPRGWHQYKHNNLVAFYAVHGPDSLATRWIAELLPGKRRNVALWTTTTRSNKKTLEEFASTFNRPNIDLDDIWNEALLAADSHFRNTERLSAPDVEMSFPELGSSATKGWDYQKWLGEITGQQRQFIEASIEKSIRLRGPAGSGKTLALALKAVREVLAAREAGIDVRVLLVTHSWSLASEIADSISAMGLGVMNEIDVFPLLEIAQAISPQYVTDESGFNLIGDDSLSGKQMQLREIQDLVAEFVDGDWITYRSATSAELSARFDSVDRDGRLALAWDLLIEFGSVIGAAAIFPGAGAESRYSQLSRANWMLPLHGTGDLRVVFELYRRYMAGLEERSLLTPDQVLADLLSHLETHAWNRARKDQGYDLIFVDEFHLFNPLERQVLHYLSRDVTKYPSVFMAVDPRQSPSEAFIGLAADSAHSGQSGSDEGLGEVANFELTSVHRFTPQILELVKHVHHSFPTLDLGDSWDVNFATVDSAQGEGPVPSIVLAASRSGEGDDIVKSVHELYAGGRIAIAVVDGRQWQRFSRLAALIGTSGKFHVSTVTGRSDIEGLGYRRRGLVVGPAEYLAGLQFETVLVAGVPDLQRTITANERTRLLSLLYLGISRAQREVRIFVNDEDGGVADVLEHGVTAKLLTRVRGSLV